MERVAERPQAGNCGGDPNGHDWARMVWAPIAETKGLRPSGAKPGKVRHFREDGIRKGLRERFGNLELIY